MALNVPAGAANRLSSADDATWAPTNQGTVFVKIKPAWNSGDSTDHVLYNCGFQNNPTQRAFRLEKFSDNNVYMGFFTDAVDSRVSLVDTGLFVAGVWANHAITWDVTAPGGVASRYYVDNVQKGTKATLTLPDWQAQSGDREDIGNAKENGAISAISVADADIAEFARWNRVLTGGEMTLLQSGYSPAFIQSGLLEYRDLRTSDRPYDAGPYTADAPDLTTNQFGISYTTHPSVIYPGQVAVSDSDAASELIRIAFTAAPIVFDSDLPGELVQILMSSPGVIQVSVHDDDNPSDNVQLVGLGSGLLAGIEYFYFVSAVDKSGNESAKSVPASIILSADSGGGGADSTPPATPASILGSSVIVISPDGTANALLTLTWGSVGDSDLDRYDVQFKRSSDSVWTIRFVEAGTTTLRELGVIPGTAYDLRVRAIDHSGNASPFATGSHTVVADSVAPGVPLAVSASGGFQIAALAWSAPADADFDQVEVWRSTQNDSSTAVKVGRTRATVYIDKNLATNTTYFYWLKSVDFSGNVSGFHAGQTSGVPATTVFVNAGDVVQASALLTQTAQIADAIITAAKIINLSADKITAGTIGAQLIRLGASQFELDGTNVYLRIVDTQGSPVTRVKLGKLGVNAADYGLEIYGADGGLQWRADGLQVSGFGRDAGVLASIFAYYHKAVFGSGTPRNTWREASEEMTYIQVSGDRIEYDILFEGTADPTLTRGALDIAAVERGPENAVSATGTTLVLNAAAVGSYVNMWIEILSNGTAAANGQTRKVVSQAGTTATVAAWGTTPTGTISYRIIRLLSVDGGNDQAGLSSKPDTQLGQRALNQWYHRTIALPSAWNGKLIIGTATAMAGVGASVTQIMLIKLPRITTAAGEVQALPSRFGPVKAALWPFGSDDNVTVTVRRESLGSMTTTESIMENAVTRGALITTTGLVKNTGGVDPIAEQVLFTFANIAFVNGIHDTIRMWVQWHAKINGGIFTIRVREGGITGTIIYSSVIDFAGGGKGVGGASTGGPYSNFTIEEPTSLGFFTYVLTAECTNVGFILNLDNVKMMTLVRSG